MVRIHVGQPFWMSLRTFLEASEFINLQITPGVMFAFNHAANSASLISLAASANVRTAASASGA